MGLVTSSMLLTAQIHWLSAVHRGSRVPPLTAQERLSSGSWAVPIAWIGRDEGMARWIIVRPLSDRYAVGGRELNRGDPFRPRPNLPGESIDNVALAWAL